MLAGVTLGYLKSDAAIGATNASDKSQDSEKIGEHAG
jgi:hypothetical protein